jgi:hypothetical protein
MNRIFCFAVALPSRSRCLLPISAAHSKWADSPQNTFTRDERQQ